MSKHSSINSNDLNDDLNSWNIKKSIKNSTRESFDDDDDDDEEQRSLALSLNLLLKHKNISSTNLVRLPSHVVTSETCRCTRSFHLFCTALFPLNDSTIEMISIHPAPRHHERDSTRQILSSVRKSRSKDQEIENMATARSEPLHMTISDGPLLDKKARISSKLPARASSLNISSNHSLQRPLQTTIKSSRSIHITTPPSSNAQLHINAVSVFDQSPFASQVFVPRGPPPSPKTPTQESSMIFSHSIMTPPFRAMGIRPRFRQFQENGRKPVYIRSAKPGNYEDHAREYLSASDCSDHDQDNEKRLNEDDNNKKKVDEDTNDNEEEERKMKEEDEEFDEFVTITKPKLSTRNLSLSRPGTSLRDRLISNNASRYLNLAEMYYSSLGVYKHLSNRSRPRLRSQTRLGTFTNENDDSATTATKTTGTMKTIPMPQSKSSFGFSKTASSMHFGHAAGRLGLHGSFERWPQPPSRRTPFERKQEVTTLRLVTLPLVTS